MSAKSIGDVSDSVVKGAKTDALLPWMQNYERELWRFVGCLCQNNEPDCFALESSKLPTKSFYCLACQQPYASKYLLEHELRADQCPRCNGNRVETDEIASGEEVVMCLHCDAKISKRRIDKHCLAIQREAEGEFDGSQQMTGGIESACKHCGRSGAQIEVTRHKGGVWLAQICDACGSNEPLYEIDVAQTFEGESHKVQLSDEVPDGFEELAQACCGLAKLHPVDNDPQDNLLVCSCERAHLICLDDCQNPKIPKTVSNLRRTLGAFSSGEMGQPFRTVKVESPAELKPGDHLDFDRRFYSHHAIVMDVLPKEKKVALVEYTGELDGRTAKAAVSFTPKGRVERTLTPFKDIEESGRLVEYHSLDCFRPAVVVNRALTRLGEKGYHVGKQNCEHFSNWAKTGLDASFQVDRFKESARKALESQMIDNVLDKLVQLFPGQKSVVIGASIIKDLRDELLQLLSIKQGALDQMLRSTLRLGLKWGIRGLPLLIATLTRQPKVLQILPMLDARVMKPIADTAVERLLPIKDKEDDKK